MYGMLNCEDCVYATYSYTSIGFKCNNKYAQQIKDIDPYDCEFFDEKTDDYIHDIEKVQDHS